MKILDRWRALLRLLILDSDRETISSDAHSIAEATREERLRANAEMDNVLRDLVRYRRERTTNHAIKTGG